MLQMAKKSKKKKKISTNRLAVFRLAIVLLSLAAGGYTLWQAFINAPYEGPPISPFIAFGVAILALSFDNVFEAKTK